MDTIIEEMINDRLLWTKAIVSLTMDSCTIYYNMLLSRYEYLRQKQEEQKTKEK